MKPFPFTPIQSALALTLLALVGATRAVAAPYLTPWQPLFKGIDLARGTNSVAAGDFQNRMVMSVLRIDLNDPDIRLLPSPRITNYVSGLREVSGMTVSRFVQTQGCQVAVNANFFDPQDYYLPEGTPMTPYGLLISRGEVVSAQADASRAASLRFDASNHASIVYTNWPPVSSAGVYNAVTGDYPLVIRGVNIGRQYLSEPGFIHQTNPRTAIGLSADRRFLFLMAIDGRQPQSTGALDYETGAWMLLVGAADAVNMDGGGSTTMSMLSSTGVPVRINNPSAVADSGRERTVGSHFGVFAKPLVDFINDVTAVPDDISATITWSTTDPATSRVEYGPTESLGFTTPQANANTTRHAVLLRGLTPGTPYYFRTLSVGTADGITHASTLRVLTTTNYAAPVTVIPIDGSWRYTASNVSAQPWTANSFSDSSWSGPGTGLLWVKTTPGNPTTGVDPLGTRITPFNSATGYPYITYYFRSRFTLPSVSPGTSIHLVGRIDDGAVIYLNGSELTRIRMDAPPAPISNTTFATVYPCAGDATCDDEFDLSGDGFLKAGENVVAVEVHNYNARSADITFGLALSVAQPASNAPALRLVPGDGVIRIEWDRGGFALQEATSPVGPWKDVAGPALTSPVVQPAGDGIRYFRLAR